MPKDEFDFEDPMELSGVALVTEEDTSGAMAECFIEEFMRMGFAPEQVLALFRNPGYLGPQLVLRRHGEPFVRTLIADIFARWGRAVVWSASPEHPASATDAGGGPTIPGPGVEPVPDTADRADLDPMGEPVPRLRL